MYAHDQFASKSEIDKRGSVHRPRNRAFRAKIASLVHQTNALSSAIQALQFLDLQELSDEIDFYEEVRRFEIALIERALLRAAGSQTGAAKLLKLNLTTLNSKLKTYEISVAKLLTNSAGERRKVAANNQK
jgi:DNA-binding NtrC family response regulator